MSDRLKSLLFSVALTVGFAAYFLLDGGEPRHLPWFVVGLAVLQAIASMEFWKRLNGEGRENSPRSPPKPMRAGREKLAWSALIAVAATGIGALAGIGMRELPWVLAGLALLWTVVFATGDLFDERERAGSLTAAFLSPVEGGLLVTEEKLSPARWGWAAVTADVRRIKVRRLSDGEQLSCLVGPRDLRLLGPAGEGSVCSSREDGEHLRSLPLLELLPAAPRTPSVLPTPAHGGCVEGETLSATQTLSAGELPRLTWAHVPRGRFGTDVLSYESADGKTAWKANLEGGMASCARHLFLTGERLVLVRGPVSSGQVSSYQNVARETRDGYVAIGFDRSSGKQRWQTNF